MNSGAIRVGRSEERGEPKETQGRFRGRGKVFSDPNFVLLRDRVDEDGEQRWHAIGLAEIAPLLLVVHVYREAKDGEEIIRIVSARKASERESRRYFF